MDYAKKNKNILHLTLDCTSLANGIVDVGDDIPMQSLVVKAIRIQFTGGAQSTTKHLFLRLSGFGQGNITSNHNIACIPIFHDSTVNDSTFYPDCMITLAKKLERRIQWALIDFDGNLPTNVNFVQVLFEYEIL